MKTLSDNPNAFWLIWGPLLDLKCSYEGSEHGKLHNGSPEGSYKDKCFGLHKMTTSRENGKLQNAQFSRYLRPDRGALSSEFTRLIAWSGWWSSSWMMIRMMIWMMIIIHCPFARILLPLFTSALLLFSLFALLHFYPFAELHLSRSAVLPLYPIAPLHICRKRRRKIKTPGKDAGKERRREKTPEKKDAEWKRRRLLSFPTVFFSNLGYKGQTCRTAEVQKR